MFALYVYPPFSDKKTSPEPKKVWPSDLISRVRKVSRKASREMRMPEFSFELTSEAAEKNLMVLKKYKYNLEEALAAQAGTPLEYGSEFRTIEELYPIFGDHPLWNDMRENLATGAIFPLKELDEETRSADFQAALERGNHKGAQKKLDLLFELMTKDVIHGYGLPLPLSKLPRVPGAVLAPVNIQAENTINEFGQIIAKDRLTHDQSFDFSPESSVNSRVIWSEIAPVRYGNCMRRIINWAVATRGKYPNTKILASKVDYKSAYRRVHMAWMTALQTCTQLPEQSTNPPFINDLNQWNTIKHCTENKR